MLEDDKIDLDLFEEDYTFVESEEDLEGISKAGIRSATITGSDWTTETILSQIDKGNIFLNPDFQRRDAWMPNRKSKFIESIILGFPIPQLVLAENGCKRSFSDTRRQAAAVKFKTIRRNG